MLSLVQMLEYVKSFSLGIHASKQNEFRLASTNFIADKLAYFHDIYIIV